MSIGSITSAFSNYAQQLTGSSGATPSSAASALQEATETKAQTEKEARNGDRVAVKKLQHEQQQESQDSDSSSEAGKGEQVDTKA
jgi:hypothetical protein